MGYLRGVTHGMLLGAAVALLYAPKPGRELRRELAARLERLRSEMEPIMEQAQEVVDASRPTVEKTISKAQQRIRKPGGPGTGS